ncbi:MAG: hypothetical protein U5S82_19155 [Gammaproteobacteria bacterium]|nr:hypothetical protein [Gammaproteobacteria bacterium]
MSELSPEEEKAILESPPKGTFAIIVLYAFVFGAAWLALYFGRFLAHGPVN